MEMQKFTRLSLLIALSVVLNIIEVMIPLFNGMIPGVKIGLANSVILFVLVFYSFKDALYVSIVRVFLVGILRTGIFSISFFFSLVGAIFSIVAMYFSYHYTKLSIIGVSVIGSICHSIGQVCVAIFFLQSMEMIYYLPFVLLFSIPTGILIGYISKEFIQYFKEELKRI